MARFMSAEAREQYDTILNLARECGYAASALAHPDTAVGQDGPYNVGIFRCGGPRIQAVASGKDHIPTVLARLLVRTVRDLHLVTADNLTFRKAMDLLESPEGRYQASEHAFRNAKADLDAARSQRQALTTLAERHDLTHQERKDVHGLTRTLGARLDGEIARLESEVEETAERFRVALAATLSRP